MIAYFNTQHLEIQAKDSIVLHEGTVLFSQKAEALQKVSKFYNEEEESKTIAIALKCMVFDSLNNIHIKQLVNSGYKVLYSQIKDTEKSGLLDKRGLKEKLLEIGFGAFMVFDENQMYFTLLKEMEVTVLKIEEKEEVFGKFFLN